MLRQVVSPKPQLMLLSIQQNITIRNKFTDRDYCLTVTYNEYNRNYWRRPNLCIVDPALTFGWLTRRRQNSIAETSFKEWTDQTTYSYRVESRVTRILWYLSILNSNTDTRLLGHHGREPQRDPKRLHLIVFMRYGLCSAILAKRPLGVAHTFHHELG